MNRSMKTQACATVVMLLVACGGSPSGRADGPGSASGKADELDEDTEGASAELAHRDGVITCELLASRVLDRTHDERVEEIVATERTRQNCLVEVDDAVIEIIDNALANVESDDAGRTSERFDARRDAVQDICNIFVEGSAGALDKAGSILSQRCGADGERQLADLIDAFVALDADRIAIPQPRPFYPECYDAFDEAGESALGHAAEITALQDLAACIADDNDTMRTRLMERIAASFPGRAPGDLEDETYRFFRLWNDAGDDVCTAFASAGEATDEAFVERQRAECAVAVDVQLGELAASVVPELFEVAPGGDTGDGDSGSTGDGGDTGGGSGGSSGG